MFRYIQVDSNGLVVGDYYLSGPVERGDYYQAPDSWPIDLVGRLFEGENCGESRYYYDESGKMVPQE